VDEQRMSERPISRAFSSNSLPLCHLLCHEQHHSEITFIHATEQPTELSKHACILMQFEGAVDDLVAAISLRRSSKAAAEPEPLHAL